MTKIIKINPNSKNKNKERKGVKRRIGGFIESEESIRYGFAGEIGDGRGYHSDMAAHEKERY